MDCRCDPTEIDGHRYNEFIARWARDCVYNAQDITSFAMGWISIVLFLFALLPQIYENFKLKHVEGLSVLFLTLWLVGDVTNLLGCVFTNQLPTQIWTAVAFVAIDLAILFQWLYYSRLYPRLFPSREEVTMQQLRQEEQAEEEEFARLERAGGLPLSTGAGSGSPLHLETPRLRKLSAVSSSAASAASAPQTPERGPITTATRATAKQSLRAIGANEQGHIAGAVRSADSAAFSSVMHHHDSALGSVSFSAPSSPASGLLVGSEQSLSPHDDDQHKAKSDTGATTTATASAQARRCFLMVLFGLFVLFLHERSIIRPFPSRMTRSLMSVTLDENDGFNDLPLCKPTVELSFAAAVIGFICSWASGVCYFVSRFPQVIKNFRRKSVQGLSMALFLITLIANLFYGLSVILRIPSVDNQFYRATLPYLVGSIGTIGFDVTILTQWRMYKQEAGYAELKDEEEEAGAENSAASEAELAAELATAQMRTAESSPSMERRELTKP